MHIQIFIKENSSQIRQQTFLGCRKRTSSTAMLWWRITLVHNETIKESKGICIIKSINNAKGNIIIREDLPAIIIIKLLSLYLWLMNLIAGLKPLWLRHQDASISMALCFYRYCFQARKVQCAWFHLSSCFSLLFLKSVVCIVLCCDVFCFVLLCFVTKSSARAV